MNQMEVRQTVDWAWEYWPDLELEGGWHAWAVPHPGPGVPRACPKQQCCVRADRQVRQGWLATRVARCGSECCRELQRGRATRAPTVRRGTGDMAQVVLRRRVRAGVRWWAPERRRRLGDGEREREWMWILGLAMVFSGLEAFMPNLGRAHFKMSKFFSRREQWVFVW